MRLPAGLSARVMTVAVAVAAAVGVTVPPSAAAEPASPGGRYCASLVGRAPEGPGAVSPVIDRECSDTSRADARARLRGARVETQARALLVTWYTAIDYGGFSEDIYGDSGPCDRRGYRLDIWQTYWRNNLSSVIGTVQCNRSLFSNNVSADTFWLPVPYLGKYNDNVHQMHVYYYS
ncbi:hypothetical protein GCM10010171_30020 [Actinokineospora fastidiosa]|uniref:Secreted protein n=2 Tax=Actinokineospora fastidiosa TaxID=1816 RepID=A0A918LDZ4_9PSEU|nr:hypothetical protein GCM10010171_30020 [Actinokineospora fastidiosa]